MPVKAIGADLVTKAFENMRLDLPNLQQRFLDEISSSTIFLLRANTPRDTGVLANSWYEVKRTNDTVIIGVKDFTPAIGKASNDEKLKYIIFGTKKHTIYPVRKKSLHWVDPDTGRDVIVKSSPHPGTAPNNFIASVLYTISLNIEATMLKIMKESHPYYKSLPFGVYYGFGTTRTGRVKHTKTVSNVVALTETRFNKRRSVGRYSIYSLRPGFKRFNRKIGLRRRTMV